MNELALFAGAGGGILGGSLLGWRTVCAVEIDPYAQRVLLARQRDGILSPFPIWDDVRTFDGHPWAGHVDIVSGGFPCQDISAAGKGAGIDGERSGLWSEFARIIREVRPRFVLVENSPMLTSRGLGRVLGDLAELGFDAEWGVLGADDAGAPHIRKRIWILAYTHRERQPQPKGAFPSIGGWTSDGGGEGRESLAHATSTGRCPFGMSANTHDRSEGGSGAGQPLGGGPAIPDALRQGLPEPEQQALLGTWGGAERGAIRELRGASLPHPSRRLIQRWRDRLGRRFRSQEGAGGAIRRDRGEGAWVGPAQSRVGRMVDGMAAGLDGPWAYEPPDLPRVARGVPNRVGRLKCIGNGQVPQTLSMAFTILLQRLRQS